MNKKLLHAVSSFDAKPRRIVARRRRWQLFHQRAYDQLHELVVHDRHKLSDDFLAISVRRKGWGLGVWRDRPRRHKASLFQNLYNRRKPLTVDILPTLARRHMEANAKAEASRAVIDALQGDRSSFITTIKAQQQVVEEQSAAVKRLAWDRKDCDDKSRRLERSVAQKEDDIKLMSEALREYQNAATEFIYENHTIHRELDRVARQNNELKQNIERQATSMSPSPVKYRTSPRPHTLTPTRRASQPNQHQVVTNGYSRMSTSSSIGRSPH